MKWVDRLPGRWSSLGYGAAIVAILFAIDFSCKYLMSVGRRAPNQLISSNACLPRGEKFAPTVEPIFATDSVQAKFVKKLMEQPPAVVLNGPNICHMLRIYGMGRINHPGVSTGEEALGILTDENSALSHLGHGLLFSTRTGVRFRLPVNALADGESHRDLFLATFGMLGLSTSTSLRAPTGSFTIRDLLNDSTANFTMKQYELAWTAMAYAYYVPKPYVWTNRDGERFSLCDLTNELLHRRGIEMTCGGIHLLEALTLISRIDAKDAVLDPPTRQAVESYLCESVAAASASQFPDGHWEPDWQKISNMQPSTDIEAANLLITGHLVEWMQHLPEGLQPSRVVYQKASAWLIVQLRSMESEPAKSIPFCPWTHAVCSLRNLVDLNNIPISSAVTAQVPAAFSDGCVAVGAVAYQ